MTDQKLIELVTQAVLAQLAGQPPAAPAQQPSAEETEPLADITDKAHKMAINIEHPVNRDALEQMKTKTPARIGVGKAGPRLKTATMLTLRADHAIARDAVFRDVDEQVLSDLNLFSVQTLCTERNEHLTRPDLGRQFSPETINQLKSKCESAPTVQIYVCDGLSSQAVDANARDVLPALMDGLKGYGIQTGTPFFVKFGRVPAMDVISEALGAQVTCVLIGERPGLATADSMSAYIAYKAAVGMPEARRTVVSNIHKGGIPAVEAGAHIATVIKTMLERKASGVDLQM
ncbi:ethanolamine ammonia-lyase subunit EutC [Youxingia wuxianensis]|uniref:Ethanolamine ammonia-lyase small subunit n=1 Tax=Youxingia wuxianensis TaxID=2763678 RepID=A0A926ERM4_9FIRM|nr:ethanolamine ammonia-lyase subunit EutC [Youxingia wuxianensis]MBC8585244.1 ethanolamine ammonia-lyase subunit EutC [Youxingia wuxianensis]